ncbi:MAG: biopolymer transporter ExbD [Planctomycetales bacterium]|nr:biopolymer transporter ExbD [Planctomycetales bacterium]
MRRRRNTKLLVEPPASATGDIAFNLIVFFLVCAAVQPDSGRPQTIPRSEETQKEQAEEEHINVQLKRAAVLLNGDPVSDQQLLSRLKGLLDSKPRPEDKVVVLNSDGDVEYQRWMSVTGTIEDAGGLLTIQTEEERTIQVP